MSTDVHLTDEEHYELLLKIKKVVQSPKFQCRGKDSMVPTTNCGMCNENFTTEKTALFPEQFPARKSMKYRQLHQACPFDKRLDKPHRNAKLGFGCFYTCRVFDQSPMKRAEALHRVNRLLAEIGGAK